MDGYVERKKLENALNAGAATDSDSRRKAWVKAICILHDVPAADVRPVVYGQWEWHGPCRDNKGTYWATCSACKTRQRLGDYESYCPNCGARMDGEAK